MSNISILHKISDRANSMEDVGKVDPDVVYDLNKLQTIANDLGTKWINSKHDDSFYYYNAIKSVKLIIEKMIERFDTPIALADFT